ncbi:MAG: hypothetical protein R2792_15100 [Saprospiraceae bacterium]
MLYRPKDKKRKYNGTSASVWPTAGMDWLDFGKVPTPASYPDNDFMKERRMGRGCEDSSKVKGIDGKYVMTYTAFDGKTARLCIALRKIYTPGKKRAWLLPIENTANSGRNPEPFSAAKWMAAWLP